VRTTIEHYDWHHLHAQYLRHVKPTSTVLEIGASNQERTQTLSEHCRELIGLEYFEDRVPAPFDNVRYVQGDWQKLSERVAPSSIDIVIASHVIEHVEDDFAAISELYMVLRQGGVALLNTPNRMRLTQSLVALVKGPRTFPDWEHVREYTSDDLETMLRLSPFRGHFEIEPLVFGVHANVQLYAKKAPRCFERWANFLEIRLFR
jgi:SAM-dependent methyltransferase